MNAPFVSVIIPVYNEGDRLLKSVQQLFGLIGYENQVIVVDGGSHDQSINALSTYEQEIENLSVITAPKGRALQMNAGAKLAKADNLLFLHADTKLPAYTLLELQRFSASKLVWGRFNVQLNNPAWPYKIISWFINKRSKLTSIATGDQAIFVKRNVFESINGYVEQPLMEDVAISCELKKISAPYCSLSTVTTSARKWEREGIIKTVWLMWKLRAAYALGVCPNKLVKVYYKL